MRPLIARLQEEAIYLRDRAHYDFNLVKSAELIEEAIAEITRLQESELEKDHTS
jgi:hypothetical protein